MTLTEQLAEAQTRYADLLANATPDEVGAIRPRYQAVMQISIDLALDRITEQQAQAAFDQWLEGEPNASADANQPGSE